MAIPGGLGVANRGMKVLGIWSSVTNANYSVRAGHKVTGTKRVARRRSRNKRAGGDIARLFFTMVRPRLPLKTIKCLFMFCAQLRLT
jgi:hypothetical protein